MEERSREVSEPGFRVTVPAAWESERDEEGGLLLAHPDGAGLLHLLAFPQEPGEPLDPAEELYAFLEDQEIELEEDEVDDLLIGEETELAFCEYLAEDEEEGETVYWLVAVATAPGNLVFASYSCPSGEEEAERETVRRVLASLRLTDPGDEAPAA
jgi:hypothetical protein